MPDTPASFCHPFAKVLRQPITIAPAKAIRPPGRCKRIRQYKILVLGRNPVLRISNIIPQPVLPGESTGLVPANARAGNQHSPQGW
jgi:hypothetical protein